jgi:hypothetical protein
MCYGRGMLRTGTLCRAVAPLAVVLAVAALAAAPATPEDVVKRYLKDLKEGDFTDAYEVISKAMKGGKDREVWVKEQKAGMAFADVKIFDVQVFPGKVEGDKAHVPNILSSQDRFVNQLGLTEYELYTLVKEDGVWKVDQQLIVEPQDIPKWFPGGGKPAAPTEPAPSH